MKILTWNINGIRSVKKEKSLKNLFDSLEADIICLQETKITREMLEEETAIVEGYNAYFSFSKVRSGYSGVVTFCRNHVTPVKAEDKIHLPAADCDEEGDLFNDEDLESLNAEGRVVLTEHVDTEGNHVVVMNLYCPRAELDNKERTAFKLRFYSLVEKKCKALLQENKHVIVLGDFNVSHKLIDHCDPSDPEIFDSNPSRQWARTFIWDPSSDARTGNPSSLASNEIQSTTDNALCITTNVPQTTKFIDSFRSFHPDQTSAFTCWCARTGARQTNYGTRIDYIFSSADYFKKEFTDCIIRPDIDGSDHCPVVATLRNSFQNAEKPPPLCTKYMPEFSGKQKKLKDFFKRSEGNTNLHDLNETGNKMSENAKLVNANESRSGMENSAKPKSSEKRPAQSTLKSQAKRLKTKNGVSQGKISQFFEKKSTKPIEGNIPMECTTVSSINESDSGISEGMNEVASQMDTQTNTSSQNSTSSSCSGSDCSTKSSSQNATGSTNKTEQKDDESYSKKHNSQENSAAVIASWKNILKGPPPAPLCSGHKEPCVLRTVKNKGPNHGKKFYCCARPDGHSTNKDARCKHFIWVKK